MAFKPYRALVEGAAGAFRPQFMGASSQRTAQRFITEDMGVTLAVDIEVHVGRRIRRRRRVLDLTQQQLGSRVGVRFQQIQRYECGASAISANRLWRLAEALEVPVSYFYEGLEGASGRTGEDAHRRVISTQEG